MPIKSDREYRNINVQDLNVLESEDGKKIVEGYATTFGTEYRIFGNEAFEFWESIDARAFDNTDMSDVIMQYDHKGRVFARRSNGTLEVHPDEHGLYIRADLGGTELGRQLYEEIRGGYTDKMSFGFSLSAGGDKKIKEYTEGKTIVHRKITSFKKIYDVSATSLPANDATEISARNFGEGVIAEIEEERLASLERQQKIKKIQIMIEMGGT